MNAHDTAILFIEFQNEFCRENGFCYPLVKDELARLKTIENAQELLSFARRKNLSVIHCPFVFDPIWYEDKKPGGLQDVFSTQKAFQPGSWGISIIEEMQPRDGEVVLSGKRGLSGFTNTTLDLLLRQRGVKNLYICGFLTNLCVQATAISAYDLGYRTRIIADACASGSAAIQEYVESTICPVLGGVVMTQDIIVM